MRIYAAVVVLSTIAVAGAGCADNEYRPSDPGRGDGNSADLGMNGGDADAGVSDDASTPDAGPAPDAAPVPDSGQDTAPEPDTPPMTEDPAACGQPAVNCTVHGDETAACVFGDHCLCSPGFVCEATREQECPPGQACIPDPSNGTRPDSCGNVNGSPVDCTAQGDEGAFCVFGDHCACSDGFVCEGGESPECIAGDICIPDPG